MRSVALVPVLGLLLAGCTGGSPQAKPSTLPPVTASPSPSPTALEVPTSAQAATPQGAAAFASYYYEEVGRAYASLDSTRLRELNSPECTGCKASADAIDRERATGRRYTGGEVTIRSAEGIADDARHTSVTLIYDRTPLVQTAGPPAARPDKGQRGTRLEVQLVRSGVSWLVSNIQAA